MLSNVQFLTRFSLRRWLCMYPVILSGCEQLYDPPCTPICHRTQLIELRCSLTVVSTSAMPALSQIKPDAHLGVLAWTGSNTCTSGGVSLIGFPQASNVKLVSFQVCIPSFGCVLFAVPPGGHHNYLTSTLPDHLIFRYLDSHFIQYGLDLLQSWPLQHPPRRS